MNIYTKLSVWLAALGIGTALGQAAEEDAKPEGTHAEIDPIRFGTHPSGKPITIKTIAMNHAGDSARRHLVGRRQDGIRAATR